MRFLFVILFFFAGCAIKQPIVSYPVSIVFKTPAIKIAASGFVKRSTRRVEVEGYMAGQPVLELIAAKRVCINGSCMSYGMFNERILGARYPRLLIYHILRGEPIFGGAGLQKDAKGFIQRIEEDNFAIIYRSNPENIYFKDSKNRILIKMRRLDG